jgi:hypothetical protein
MVPTPVRIAKARSNSANTDPNEHLDSAQFAILKDVVARTVIQLSTAQRRLRLHPSKGARQERGVQRPKRARRRRMMFVTREKKISRTIWRSSCSISPKKCGRFCQKKTSRSPNGNQPPPTVEDHQRNPKPTVKETKKRRHPHLRLPLSPNLFSRTRS